MKLLLVKKSRRHLVIDKLSNGRQTVEMTKPNLTWDIVDAVADRLGVKIDARRKWRSRGIPAAWRIAVANELIADGMTFTLADMQAFDRLKTRDETEMEKVA
jgi:hypothetical protein